MRIELEESLAPLVGNLKPLFLERANRDSVIVDIKHNKDLQEELWEVYANMVLTNEIDLFAPNIHEFFNLILPHFAFKVDSIVENLKMAKQLKGTLNKYNTNFEVKQYLPAWKGQEHIVHLGTPIIGSEFQVREIVKTFCETDLYELVGMDILLDKPTKESYYDLGIKDYKYNKIPYCKKCVEKLYEHMESINNRLVYPCIKVQDLENRELILMKYEAFFI
ncbi:hypothetical protein M3Y14_33480 (plasmid) [Bacillus thuringiensis]|uniref:hypothetical protein n=1 Tax=Bacillus thuringiensis TaxID=1428 RepID=UPI0022247C79|nr:hypothetical protein [Bacillus thuringiensis]UYX56178.1 hypothetical protein M3Y14_33480 [Bacillus thuringiensis]